MTEPPGGRAALTQEGREEPPPGYDWNLRPLMARRHLWKTVELAALLRQRGITLSYPQIRRLVTGKPQYLSLPVLAALCDILGCTPSDLITLRGQPGNTAASGQPGHRGVRC